jgi:hypothetical protein
MSLPNPSFHTAAFAAGTLALGTTVVAAIQVTDLTIHFTK